MAKFVFKAKKATKVPIFEAKRQSYSKRKGAMNERIKNFTEDAFEDELEALDNRNQQLSDTLANLERQLGLPVGGEEDINDDL